MTSRRGKTSLATMALALAAGLALSGCGSADNPAAVAGSGATAEAGAFPVTIDNAFGSTTITESPTRVAAVGIGDADVLLSLGVTPILVPVWTGSTNTGIGKWAEPLVAGDRPTALANGTTDFSLEAVAAADPDVIIAVNNAIDETRYQQLSAIAPTVLHAAGQTDWVLPWQDVATRIGAAVGLPARAAQVIADTEAQVAQARTDNPQFEGKSAVLVTVRPDGSLRAFSPAAARFQLLTQLGFVPPAQLTDRFQNGVLSFDVTAETLNLLDADVLLVDNYDKFADQLEAMGTFKNLNVVKNGGLVKLDPIVSDAVSMPNPLTIPFVLGAFVEQINATPVGSAA